MEWEANNDPNVLPEHNHYLIYVKQGDYYIACPEQDGWWADGERIEHSEVTHYCIITRP